MVDLSADEEELGSEEEYYNNNYSSLIQSMFRRPPPPASLLQMDFNANDEVVESGFGQLEEEERRSEAFARLEDRSELLREKRRKALKQKRQKGED